MRAWISNEPWSNSYELRLAGDFGTGTAHAKGVEDGQIVWEQKDRTGLIVEPFMTLSRGEYEALAAAFGEVTQSSDATVDALRDTREVRDRLLSMIERERAE